MKASNNFIQAQEVEEQKGAFLVADSTLVAAKVISIGNKAIDKHEGIKINKTILFPRIHGKVMQHSIKGVKYYFVDKDVVLAYE